MSGEEKGPITRTRKQNAERAFNFVIEELFEKKMDDPITLSLLRSFG